MRSHGRFIVLPAAGIAAALMLLGNQVSATTIGYWQFEGTGSAWLNDSSGNGHTLETRGTSAPTQYPLPATGPGSAFPNPVPQTGQPNLDGTSLNGSGWLVAADSPTFSVNALTIEAFVNPSNLNTPVGQIFAGHFLASATPAQRSWYFGLIRSGDATRPNQLQVALSNDGGTAEVLYSSSALQLVEGKDFYVAATISTGANPADRNVTFFLQNLTDGGALLTHSVTHSKTSLHDSTAPFSIGSQGSTSNTNNFFGVIDEVRFSSGVLAADELLVVVPEPAAGLLAAVAAACGLAAWRCKRSG